MEIASPWVGTRDFDAEATLRFLRDVARESYRWCVRRALQGSPWTGTWIVRHTHARLEIECSFEGEAATEVSLFEEGWRYAASQIWYQNNLLVEDRRPRGARSTPVTVMEARIPGQTSNERSQINLMLSLTHRLLRQCLPGRRAAAEARIAVGGVPVLATRLALKFFVRNLGLVGSSSSSHTESLSEPPPPPPSAPASGSSSDSPPPPPPRYLARPPSPDARGP